MLFKGKAGSLGKNSNWNNRCRRDRRIFKQVGISWMLKTPETITSQGRTESSKHEQARGLFLAGFMQPTVSRGGQVDLPVKIGSGLARLFFFLLSISTAPCTYRLRTWKQTHFVTANAAHTLDPQHTQLICLGVQLQSVLVTLVFRIWQIHPTPPSSWEQH